MTDTLIIRSNLQENFAVLPNEMINDAYDDAPGPAEETLREGMRRHQRQLVEGQW